MITSKLKINDTLSIAEAKSITAAKLDKETRVQGIVAGAWIMNLQPDFNKSVIIGFRLKDDSHWYAPGNVTDRNTENDKVTVEKEFNQPESSPKPS